MEHVTLGTCEGCFSKKCNVFRPDTAQKVQVLHRGRLRRKLGSIEQEQEQKEQKEQNKDKKEKEKTKEKEKEKEINEARGKTKIRKSRTIRGNLGK